MSIEALEALRRVSHGTDVMEDRRQYVRMQQLGRKAVEARDRDDMHEFDEARLTMGSASFAYLMDTEPHFTSMCDVLKAHRVLMLMTGEERHVEISCTIRTPDEFARAHLQVLASIGEVGGILNNEVVFGDITPVDDMLGAYVAVLAHDKGIISRDDEASAHTLARLENGKESRLLRKACPSMLRHALMSAMSSRNDALCALLSVTLLGLEPGNASGYERFSTSGASCK